MRKLFTQLLFILIPVLSIAQNNGSNTHTDGAVNALIDNFAVKLFSIQAGGGRVETDGLRAKFGATYCACVDGDDATKFMSSGIESISLLREGISLVIEARPYIIAPDTLYIKTDGMIIGGDYEFQITPTNFDTSVAACRVYDHFLNTDTLISLSAVSNLPFNVTTAIGSAADGRFSIVFYPTIALPINSFNINAYKQNNNVIINWETFAESNIKTYTIEKSVNGTLFTKLSNVDARNGNTNNKYSFIDKTPVDGNNYYRIKTLQANDNMRYSNILVVNFKTQNASQFVVYPNPVQGNTIGLQLNNMEAGKYVARLFNAVGQEVYTNTITHNGFNESMNLQISKPLTFGVYHLKLIDIKGISYTQNILVVE